MRAAARARTRRTVALRVEDRGPGIPRAERGRVFEPFYRGHGARRSQAPGSGLGLSLVRHVVEAHGGRVRVEARDGRRDHGGDGASRGRSAGGGLDVTTEEAPAPPSGGTPPCPAGRGRAEPRPHPRGPPQERGLRGRERAGRRRRASSAASTGAFDLILLDVALPGPGRLRRAPRPAPEEGGDARPHAHRPRAGGRPRAGTQAGRRRLPAQAVRHDGAAGPHRGGAAAAAGLPAGNDRELRLRRRPRGLPPRRGVPRRASPSSSRAWSSSCCATSSSTGERSLSRHELLEKVWGYPAVLQTRTVDVHVASLRQKIEPHPGQARAHRDRPPHGLPLQRVAPRPPYMPYWISNPR